jgi:hypothetical protein
MRSLRFLALAATSLCAYQASAAAPPKLQTQTISIGGVDVSIDLPKVKSSRLGGPSYSVDMPQATTVFFGAPYSTVSVGISVGTAKDFGASWNWDTNEKPQLQTDVGFNRQVKYKIKKSDWYVSTGTAGDRSGAWIFYIRSITSGDRLVRVEYDLPFSSDEELSANKPLFDSLVDASSRSIRISEQAAASSAGEIKDLMELAALQIKYIRTLEISSYSSKDAFAGKIQELNVDFPPCKDGRRAPVPGPEWLSDCHFAYTVKLTGNQYRMGADGEIPVSIQARGMVAPVLGRALIYAPKEPGQVREVRP